MNDINHSDDIQLLRTIMQHRDHVRLSLQKITHDLERRALAHDMSKMNADEFAGFSRINKAAREHPYGSDEYREGLRQEKPTIDLHYSRNSHHPEFHELRPPRYGQVNPKYWGMGLLDLIEMVCDWRGAYLGYGSQGTWEQNIERQHSRFMTPDENGHTGFSKSQWWVVEQLAALLGEE